MNRSVPGTGAEARDLSDADAALKGRSFTMGWDLFHGAYRDGLLSILSDCLST